MENLISVKTSELTGASLDWAMGKATGIEYQHRSFKVIDQNNIHITNSNFSPSTRLSDLIPLIKIYDILYTQGGKAGCNHRGWFAVVGLPNSNPPVDNAFSESLKVAICRAIAIFEFGCEISVPANLVGMTA